VCHDNLDNVFSISKPNKAKDAMRFLLIITFMVVASVAQAQENASPQSLTLDQESFDVVEEKAQIDAVFDQMKDTTARAIRSDVADRAADLLSRPTQVVAADDYETVFPFRLTPQKMVDFTIVALDIESVNARWDLMIAGAESDEQAIEFNDFARDELAAIFVGNKNITIEQYQMMLNRTLIDPQFAEIFSSYKDLYLAGLMDETGEILWDQFPDGQKLKAALGG